MHNTLVNYTLFYDADIKSHI